MRKLATFAGPQQVPSMSLECPTAGQGQAQTLQKAKLHKVMIADDLARELRQIQPPHRQTYSLSTLVYEALWAVVMVDTVGVDGCATLGKTDRNRFAVVPAPPEQCGSGGEVFTSIEKKKEDKKTSCGKNSRVKAKYTDEFERFWTVWTSSPLLANQSKKAAFTKHWEDACADVGPQKLLEAAQAAVNEQVQRIQAGGEPLMLPDCFRWLREERYQHYLDKTTTVTIQPKLTSDSQKDWRQKQEEDARALAATKARYGISD